ncbi:nucleotide-binding domain-containing protein [Peniophora sp. CONT]|nr:nucleotide-binding domain-containing protein [Peniophora sp. CONT]
MSVCARALRCPGLAPSLLIRPRPAALSARSLSLAAFSRRPPPSAAPGTILARIRALSTLPETPATAPPPAQQIPPTPPPPKPKGRISRTASYAYRGARICVYLAVSSVVGVAVLVSAIFIHDAFTYTDRHVERVPVNPLALNPSRGGPKNLPIASVLVSDEEDEFMVGLKDKPRLVILGGGWGAVSTLMSLNDGAYHVTVIAPETFNTFTPLLPSAAVGTVSIRSLIEPLRKIVARVHGQFLTGRAVDIVMHERLLEIETPDAHGNMQHIYVPYDKLVIAVGSVSSTHGVPGLENCFQLKTVGDAQAIRRRVLDNFEIASLPTTTQEERKRLLSFVVCGGGPTGVETAAEIHDLCLEDIINYYPKICREEVSIHIIQSREHILNTYSEAISNYAEQKFKRDDVNLITSARVAEVTPEFVTYTTKDENGKTVRHTIPSNFVLWSTGIAMNPFTQRVSSLLPNQVHRKAIETDAHLRVKGSPLGTVYAVGDCATIETSIVDHLLDLVEEADRDKNGKIDYEEWQIMVKRIKHKIPMAESHLSQVRELFSLYDKDKDDALTLNELATLLQELGNKITALPATAQVASQQGHYLGAKLSKLAEKHDTLLANEIPETDEAVSGAFRYLHLGSLAYIGNAAVFDLGRMSFMGGLAAMYAWRSVYWSEQVSMRIRMLLMIDWVVRGVWGRDLSRL